MLFTMGVGTEFKNIFIDFSTSYQPELGFSPHLSLRYKFDKHEESE